MPPDSQFEQWLATATRKLSPDSIERIRAEIGEHYHYTLASGASPEQAIAALGDPKAANRDYRKVLLTRRDAWLLRRLRPQSGESQMSRTTTWLGVVLALYLANIAPAWLAFHIVAMTVWMLLPLARPKQVNLHRYEMLRLAKWTALLAAAVAFALWFGAPDPGLFGGIIIAVVAELPLIPLRRKLPVKQWPETLFQ